MTLPSLEIKILEIHEAKMQMRKVHTFYLKTDLQLTKDFQCATFIMHLVKNTFIYIPKSCNVHVTENLFTQI